MNFQHPSYLNRKFQTKLHGSFPSDEQILRLIVVPANPFAADTLQLCHLFALQHFYEFAQASTLVYNKG